MPASSLWCDYWIHLKAFTSKILKPIFICQFPKKQKTAICVNAEEGWWQEIRVETLLVQETDSQGGWGWQGPQGPSGSSPLQQGHPKQGAQGHSQAAAGDPLEGRTPRWETLNLHQHAEQLQALGCMLITAPRICRTLNIKTILSEFQLLNRLKTLEKLHVLQCVFCGEEALLELMGLYFQLCSFPKIYTIICGLHSCFQL